MGEGGEGGGTGYWCCTRTHTHTHTHTKGTMSFARLCLARSEHLPALHSFPALIAGLSGSVSVWFAYLKFPLPQRSLNAHQERGHDGSTCKGPQSTGVARSKAEAATKLTIAAATQHGWTEAQHYWPPCRRVPASQRRADAPSASRWKDSQVCPGKNTARASRDIHLRPRGRRQTHRPGLATAATAEGLGRLRARCAGLGQSVGTQDKPSAHLSSSSVCCRGPCRLMSPGVQLEQSWGATCSACEEAKEKATGQGFARAGRAHPDLTALPSDKC